MSKHPDYTKAEDSFIRKWYKHKDSRWIAQQLHRPYSGVKSRLNYLGLRRTAEERKAISKNMPRNKGQFKKGIAPHNTLTNGEITFRSSCGYWMIKTEQGSEFYHRWLWEQAHGKIPEGRNITILLEKEHWKDDWQKITLEHLELISNAELARRNVDYEKASKTQLEKVWTDEYIAKQITKHHDIAWQEVMGTPLIPIKRAEILINRKLKDHDTSRETQ